MLVWKRRGEGEREKSNPWMFATLPSFSDTLMFTKILVMINSGNRISTTDFYTWMCIYNPELVHCKRVYVVRSHISFII